MNEEMVVGDFLGKSKTMMNDDDSLGHRSLFCFVRCAVAMVVAAVAERGEIPIAMPCLRS
jgi:hypothetical protein